MTFDQKEGNGNLNMICLRYSEWYTEVYIRNISSWCHSGRGREWTKTYSDNSGIIGHHRGPALLGRLWRVVNPQVLDIGAAKDNVVVDLIRGGDLVIGIASAALTAKGLDILERDGRLFGVDLVEDTGVAGES